RSHTFLYRGGIVEFVKHLNQNKTPIHPKVLYFEGKKGDIEVEVALQYNDGYQENVFSFANNINTREGGTHLTGFRAALTSRLAAYAEAQGFLKGFKGGVSGDDVREGLTAVVSRSEGKKGDIEVEVALQYNDGYQENVFSFANNINTREGGTHLTGFRAALTSRLAAYAEAQGFLKGFKGGVSGDDVREGLTAVVS